jgi:hypothetical protein
VLAAAPHPAPFVSAGKVSTPDTDAARRKKPRVELVWEEEDGTCVKCFLTLADNGTTTVSAGNRRTFALIRDSFPTINQNSLSFDCAGEQRVDTRKGKTPFSLDNAGITYSVKAKDKAENEA